MRNQREERFYSRGPARHAPNHRPYPEPGPRRSLGASYRQQRRAGGFSASPGRAPSASGYLTSASARSQHSLRGRSLPGTRLMETLPQATGANYSAFLDRGSNGLFFRQTKSPPWITPVVEPAVAVRSSPHQGEQMSTNRTGTLTGWQRTPLTATKTNAPLDLAGPAPAAIPTRVSPPPAGRTSTKRTPGVTIHSLGVGTVLAHAVRGHANAPPPHHLHLSGRTRSRLSPPSNSPRSPRSCTRKASDAGDLICGRITHEDCSLARQWCAVVVVDDPLPPVHAKRRRRR